MDKLFQDLEENVGEFESFVHDYSKFYQRSLPSNGKSMSNFEFNTASQLDRILKGELTEEEKQEGLKELEKSKLSTDVPITERNAETTAAVPLPAETEVVSEDLKEKDVKESENDDKKEEVNEDDGGEDWRKCINYSKWERLPSDDEDESEKSTPASKTKTTETKAPMPAKKKPSTKPFTPAYVVKAQELKEKGNKSFSSKDYAQAIEYYSEAITTYLNPPPRDPNDVFGFLPSIPTPPDAVLYSNRALCYLHLKQYDRVVDDCSNAIELDPNAVKAFWRRADAYIALQKWDSAKQDVEMVEKLVFGDVQETGEKKKYAITKTDIETKLADIEREKTAWEKDQSLKQELSKDGSIDIVRELVRLVVDNVEKLDAAAPTKEISASYDMLKRLMEQHSDAPNVFRLCKGFDQVLGLFKQSFTQESKSRVAGGLKLLEIVMESLRPSPQNRKEFAKYLDTLLNFWKTSYQKMESTLTTKTSNCILDTMQILLQDAASSKTVMDSLKSNDEGVLGTLVANSTGLIVLSVLTSLVKLTDSFEFAFGKTGGVLLDKAMDVCVGLLKTKFHHVESFLDTMFTLKSSATTLIQDFEKALNKRMDVIVNMTVQRLKISTTVGKSDEAISLLPFMHNLFLHLDHALEQQTAKNCIELLGKLALGNSVNHSNKELMGNVFMCLSKLCRFHAVFVSTTLLTHWKSATLPLLLQSSRAYHDDLVTGFTKEFNLVERTLLHLNAVMQLFATAFFQAATTSQLDVFESFDEQGGLKHVSEVFIFMDSITEVTMVKNGNKIMDLEALPKWVIELIESGKEDEEKMKRVNKTMEKVVGNIALSLGEVAKNYGVVLHGYGVVDPLIKILRRVKDPLVQKNVSIFCARLCQSHPDVLQRVRELKGIELMYSLGPKILEEGGASVVGVGRRR